MKIGKKILSLILVVIMLFSAASINSITATSNSDEIKVGDEIEFGSYPQSAIKDENGNVTGYSKDPIKWRVLKISDGKVLLLSSEILDVQAYHNTASTVGGYYPNNYARSTVRQWLINDFYNEAFSNIEQDVILTTTLDNSAAATNIGASGSYTQYSSVSTNDKVFLLSKDEANSYASKYFNASATDYAYSKGYATTSGAGNAKGAIWLLRTAGNNITQIYYVHMRWGEMVTYFNWSGEGVLWQMGVRPAIYIDLEAYDEHINSENLNVYNFGEETYGFPNYSDPDSPTGHCFAMAMTSSGYHLGILDPTNVGANSSRDINALYDNPTVKKPICYYQPLQGSLANRATVAGGTNYKSYGLLLDIENDWDEVVNYVKNHDYDNMGSLQIDYRTVKKDSIIQKIQYGHGVNFLWYDEETNSILIYDNRYPSIELITKDPDGNIVCSGDKDKSLIIGSIALRDVSSYFSAVANKEIVEDFLRLAIYAMAETILIETGGAVATYLLSASDENAQCNLYELPQDTTTVKITPLVDNATFTYMGQEYNFDEIDEDTCAEFTLSTSEEDTPKFRIINAPSDEPEPHEHNYENGICTACGKSKAENCSHMCHKSGFMGFFWKILNFFYKLFRINPICDCGMAHY